MDKPIFIRCEDCGETYREVHVLKRSQLFITDGKCMSCIYQEYKEGNLTDDELKRKLQKFESKKG